jgi:hypothetical protein
MFRALSVTSVVRNLLVGAAFQPTASQDPISKACASENAGQGAATSVFTNTGRQPNAATMTPTAFPASTIKRLIAGTI